MKTNTRLSFFSPKMPAKEQQKKNPKKESQKKPPKQNKQVNKQKQKQNKMQFI